MHTERCILHHQPKKNQKLMILVLLEEMVVVEKVEEEKVEVETEVDKVDIYEWYYHAQACFQSTGVMSSRYWRAWNKSFQRVVVGAQKEDGHWSYGLHFHGDTDIYCTTLSILMLEVYYRFAPMGKV